MQYRNTKLVLLSQGSAIPGLLKKTNKQTNNNNNNNKNTKNTVPVISVEYILIKLRLMCPAFFVDFLYWRDCYDSFRFFAIFFIFFFVRLEKPYTSTL